MKKILRGKSKGRPLEQWQLMELASVGLTPKSVEYTRPMKSGIIWYKELEAFYKEFGHCHVTERIADGLGKWVGHIKSQLCGLTKGQFRLELTIDRLILLAQVGLTVESVGIFGVYGAYARWNQNMDEAQEFYDAY
jgi:hypothetical protein